MTYYRHHRVGLLAATLLALASAACGRHGSAAPQGGSDLRPSQVVLQRNVELGRSQARSLVYHVETIGVLEAEGQTDIAAGVTGVVDEVLFREGDEVGVGTVLVKVDQDKYQSEEAVAQANVARAQANVAMVQDLLERVERVGRAASDEDRSKARGTQRMAEAELRASQATLLRAKNNLDRSRVRAPYTGRINKRLVTKGSYLEEKTTIATMADLSRIRLTGYVPENASPLVRKLLQEQPQRVAAVRATLPLGGLGPQIPWAGFAGLSLVQHDYVLSGFDPEFELFPLPGQQFHARIFYMSTVANADTHMFEAKAEVIGTPQQSSEMQPGFTAKIRFPMRSNPNACLVPEEAVRASERGFIAFVPSRQQKSDGSYEWVARARMLDLGYRGNGWVEVRSGLAAGEWLVRRGAEALEDGTPIRFRETLE